jgi:hypothetical protein
MGLGRVTARQCDSGDGAQAERRRVERIAGARESRAER